MQAHNDFALLWSTISFIVVGAIRVAAGSGITWLAAAAQPYVPLEYLFFFIGVTLFFYGWLGWKRLALLFAFLATIGYYVIATGAGF